jgi:hypothetical protein
LTPEPVVAERPAPEVPVALLEPVEAVRHDDLHAQPVLEQPVKRLQEIGVVLVNEDVAQRPYPLNVTKALTVQSYSVQPWNCGPTSPTSIFCSMLE